MSFSIVTDTSANLPTPWLEEHDVTVIPFHYTVNGREMACLDTEAFNGAAFYTAMRNGTAVTTSQINPQAYIDTITPLLQAGRDILFVGMSSGISGSFQSAQIAVTQLRESFPGREFRMVDTLGASLGEGILVMRAAEYRDRHVPGVHGGRSDVSEEDRARVRRGGAGGHGAPDQAASEGQR